MKKFKIFLYAISILFPSFVWAQLDELRDVNEIKIRLLTLFDVIIYLLVALAVIFIVYHVVRYIVMGSKPEEKGKAGLNILWGLIGLFIIVSIWGLVNILTGTFNTYNYAPVERFPSTNFFQGGSGYNGNSGGYSSGQGYSNSVYFNTSFGSH